MIYADDLGAPEGPVLLPDGSWLVVEMAGDRGCVTRLTDGGRQREVIARTGRPNGLAVDRSGVIWVAESQPPALLRLTLDGRYEQVLDYCGDDPFLFPNDLCFGPDQMLYITDSGLPFEKYAPDGKVRDDYLTTPTDGRIYRVDPDTRHVTKLATGIKFANGIAFGPGDHHLYVAETNTGNILRYRWAPRNLGEGEVFANVLDPEARAKVKGPDGIAFGSDGDLYVAVYGQGEVAIIAADGSVRKHIPTRGTAPTNLAFGFSPSQEIYVTEVQYGSIEILKADTDGLSLHA